MNTGRAPVIIMGMHRSGTSLVTRLLERMGLFAGWRQDDNAEAWFFMRLNEWLLRQCGGAWDQPAAIYDLLGNAQGRDAVADYLRRMLAAPQTLSYLGPVRYARHGGLFNMTQPWGWKDPRNTFTLPLWLELFPDARVVHVYRHGVDVAASLHRRQRISPRQRRRRALKGALGRLAMPRWGGFVDSWRCADLDRAVSLWSEYVGQARAHVAGLGPRAMEVRYEELLAHPGTALATLARFCGLPGSAAQEAAGGITASRALAYRSDAGLRALAERWQSRLQALGY